MFIGVLIGLAVSNRILGLSLIPLYALFRMYQIIFLNPWIKVEPRWQLWATEGLDFLLIIISSQVTACLFWPYVAQNYFKNIRIALDAAKQFPWDGTVLFMGQFIHASQLPLYYLPTLIVITTPLFILGFFLLALVFSKKCWRNQTYVLMLLALVLNLGLYFGLKPVIYGIRHFLFLLPILVVVAALGAIEFFRGGFSKRVRVVIGLAALLNGFVVSAHMVRLYPYYYIYLNEIVGGVKGAQGTYSTSDWGESLREDVLWLRQNEITDPNRIYQVNFEGNVDQVPCYFSKNMKGHYSDDDRNSDYYVELQDDLLYEKADPSKVIHVVEREGVPLSYVVKSK